MKLGVFNLWTEMRDVPPSAAFEAAPLFEVADNSADQASRLSEPSRRAPAKKRKSVVIVDEITAS